MRLQTALLEKILKQLTEPQEPFKKPTVEEIRAYIEAKGSKVDPQAFYNYYESVGWKVGKKPMKSWESAIATWEKKDKSSKTLEL